MPILKDPSSFKKIALPSIIISAIYLFLSVICLLMTFQFIPFSEEMLSVYLITRMISLGKFFQRIDAIFILIWILSTISFLTFTTNFITIILKKLLTLKSSNQLVYASTSLIFSCSLIVRSIANIKFLQNEIIKYLILILIFIISPIILILANIKVKRRKIYET